MSSKVNLPSLREKGYMGQTSQNRAEKLEYNVAKSISSIDLL